MVRGAFEYQGQKCSAASRAYVPASLWEKIKDELVDITNGLSVGTVTDLRNFMGAVIDERAFATHRAAIDRAHATGHLHVVAGGSYDDSEGWFVRPTVVVSDDPTDEIFATEYFGPVSYTHLDVYKRQLLTGRTLEEAAPSSPARVAIAELAARLVGIPTPTRRRGRRGTMDS